LALLASLLWTSCRRKSLHRIFSIMVTAIPTEESTKRGRKSSSAQSSPPFQLTDHEHFPPLPNGGGGSPSTCTTLALSQESSYLSDSESEDFPPAKKSRSGASSEEARITPCCSCSVHSTCTSLRTCACRSAGRACTACDPGSVGKCRCTTSTRSWAANALKSARERRAHEIAADAAARAAREKRTKQTSIRGCYAKWPKNKKSSDFHEIWGYFRVCVR
jgi:hypothetical protein